MQAVSKTYGRFGPRSALDGVALELRAGGETVGLTVPTARQDDPLLSLGFLRPTGDLTVDGRAPDDSPCGRGRIPAGELGFDRSCRARFFLAFPGGAGGDRERAGTEVEAAADRVGLDREALSRPLRGYSRGMLQRIGLAQALLRDPAILFLDEPASGTDPRGVSLVRDRILEAKARGATIVLNSHQLPEAAECATACFLEGAA